MVERTGENRQRKGSGNQRCMAVDPFASLAPCTASGDGSKGVGGQRPRDGRERPTDPGSLHPPKRDETQRGWGDALGRQPHTPRPPRILFSRSFFFSHFRDAFLFFFLLCCTPLLLLRRRGRIRGVVLRFRNKCLKLFVGFDK